MLDEQEQSKDNASSAKECSWCKARNQWYKGHSEETCEKKSGAWTLAKNPKEKDKKLPHQGGVYAVEDQENNSASSAET